MRGLYNSSELNPEFGFPKEIQWVTYFTDGTSELNIGGPCSPEQIRQIALAVEKTKSSQDNWYKVLRALDPKLPKEIDARVANLFFKESMSPNSALRFMRKNPSVVGRDLETVAAEDASVAK